jgi:hypothetical protein
MRELLYEAAGDIDAKTNGALQFYVDTVGASGNSGKVRHNCYLRVPKTGYNHLLFRVTTPLTSPWPAEAATPEGESYAGINNEQDPRNALQQILQRERTKEIVSLSVTMPRVGPEGSSPALFTVTTRPEGTQRSSRTSRRKPRLVLLWRLFAGRKVRNSHWVHEPLISVPAR